MKPVVEAALLPYPSGNSLPSLQQFDQDLRRALVDVLFQHAFRINRLLPMDGSEPMTGPLNMGQFAIDNVDKITIRRAAAPTTQYFEIGVSDAGGHNYRGFSLVGNAKPNIYDSTTDVANTAPSAGANGHNFRIRGVDVFNIDNNGRVNLPIGQVNFPAVHNPSTGANVLDDYEEGTFTPTFTFATPGDVAVTYTEQFGRYIKIGKMVTVWIRLIASTITHTTAAGEWRITGLPFATPVLANMQWSNGMELDGFIMPAGRTWVGVNMVNNASHLRFVAMQGRIALTAADHTTGVPVGANFTLTYEASA